MKEGDFSLPYSYSWFFGRQSAEYLFYDTLDAWEMGASTKWCKGTGGGRGRERVGGGNEGKACPLSPISYGLILTRGKQ